MARAALVFAVFLLTSGAVWTYSMASDSTSGSADSDLARRVWGAALLAGSFFVYRFVKPMKAARFTKIALVIAIALLAAFAAYQYLIHYSDSAASNIRLGAGGAATYKEYPLSGASFFAIVTAVLYVAVPFQTWFLELCAKAVEEKRRAKDASKPA